MILDIYKSRNSVVLRHFSHLNCDWIKIFIREEEKKKKKMNDDNA